MSSFTRDEIVAQLVGRNVPRHLAERAADRELADRLGRRMDPSGKTNAIAELLDTPRDREARAALRELEPVPAGEIAWPVRLLLPWSLLVSDNERKEPYLVYEDGKPHARMRLTKRYREAAAKIEQLAKGKLGDAQPTEQLLDLTARVWVPGGSYSRNDVCNFGKGVHDALEGVVYVNDNQLHGTHWLRAGVDVDAPRAELTINPLPHSGG